MIREAMKSKWLLPKGAVKTLPVSLLLAGLLCADLLAQGRLYRYRDAQGRVVISHSIPTEFAAKGYDVLSNRGRVLETVAPHVPLTDAERVAKARHASQQEEDRYLLRSYSSVADIEAARDRKLDSLRREIALIEGNLESTRQLRNREERRAANFQRSGRDISESLFNTLQELQRKERDARLVLEQRRAECETEEQRYAHYINRYRELVK